MPQMAPMWWSLMYMFTLTTLYLMMIMVFFNKNQKESMKSNKINFKNNNWKW
uniref:ATP synthase F0 subunit 8 n=1 Tax=Neoplerochila paliatseasi TaxID=2704509 RepID=UPI0013E97350|nr:ATP synthase F0 subunit 8 [Neoplerochila paliatseasi]QHR79419.1 ATP synthase F0 subunit 8 [Neoplerochila paliatseasi]